jgi:hypothetical protein
MIARHLRSTWADIVALLVLVVVWWRFAGSLFFGPGHLYLIDTALMDVPLRVHAAELIRAGHFPFWTSMLECGFPQFSEGQSGILYPFFWIYLIWPSATGNDVFVAVHYLMMALGMYAYLRGREITPWAAVLGSAAWFGGPLMQAAHVMPGFLAVAAWLPLGLLSIDCAATGSRRALCCCVLVNTAMLLTGGPNLALLCFLTELAYISKTSWSHGMGTFVMLATYVFVVPVFLAAVQLVPTYQYLKESHRGGGTPWEAVVYNCVFSWRDAFTMGVARAVDIPSSWPGYAVVASLSVFALFARRSADAIFWLAVGAFGVLVATGSPVLWWLYRLPPMNWFRWPMFYLFLTHFALAVLMAMGTDVVLQRLQSRYATSGPDSLRFLAGGALTAIAALSATWCTMQRCKSHGDFYTLAAPEVVEAARTAKHFRLLPLMRGMIEGSDPDYPPEFWPPSRIRNSVLQLAPNYSAIHRVPVAVLKNQFDAVTPREFTELMFAAVPPTIGILRTAGVTHLTDVAPLPSDLADELTLISNYPVYFYRLNRPAPRAWMVYRSETIEDPQRRIARLAEPGFDPLAVAILNQPVSLAGTLPLALPTVSLDEPAPGQLRADVFTEVSGLLVVADRFSPDIVARLDGQPVELLRVNHAFRGVVIPAGSHVIEMHYVPRAFYAGLGITLATAILLVAGMVSTKGKQATMCLGRGWEQ